MNRGLKRFLVRQSLATRLLVMLTLALLPLGLIAVYQTVTVVREATTLSERDILVRTAEAAKEELALVQRALGSAQGLGASVRGLPPGDPACAKVFSRFVEDSPFNLAMFFETGGGTRCSSAGDARDFREFEIIRDFFENPVQMVTITQAGRSSGESVMVAMRPVFDERSELLGGVAISIPHSLSDRLLANRIDDMEIALIDADGTVLSASTGIDNIASFEALGVVPNRLVMGSLGIARRVTSTTGGDRLVAVVPLIPGNLYALGRWSPAASVPKVSLLGAATPAFPVLMWLASLFVAFLAIDRLVLRHLKILRASMSRFSPDSPGKGHARLSGAPSEVSDIADSYNRMIDRIAADHANLEANVREKEVLLKEIHHRVKNNLQLIASILNMQIRKIDSDDVRSVLRRVQDRVMSLALIHKTLYPDTQVDVVRADALLDEIIRSVMKSAAVPGGPEIAVDLAPVRLDPDQAVPLSLLVTEAVTNAVKYSGQNGAGGSFIRIWMTEPDPGRVELRVVNSRGQTIPPVGDDGSGLGSRLIFAFASQLGGEIHVAETESEYAISVEFPKLKPAAPSPNAAT